MFKGLRYSQGEFANYEPSGRYMYRQFNIQQFYVLPTQTVFMCFVWIWEQTAIISLYNINWLVCITDGVFTARYELDLYMFFRLLSQNVVGGCTAQTVAGKPMLRLWLENPATTFRNAAECCRLAWPSEPVPITERPDGSCDSWLQLAVS